MGVVAPGDKKTLLFFIQFDALWTLLAETTAPLPPTPPHSSVPIGRNTVCLDCFFQNYFLRSNIHSECDR